ncbi:MAG: hypothetical protein CMN28_03300 [Salinisphaeraceae bacterium]|nr:hypothetical protein [Salinisphaeraceae bacterium]
MGGWDPLSWLERGSDYARAHDVDPLVFIGIYLITTPPFIFVSGWLLHSLRKKKPLEVLLFLWGLLYCAPYIYVLIEGDNLAWWMYAAMTVLLTGGIGISALGLRRRLREEDNNTVDD